MGIKGKRTGPKPNDTSKLEWQILAKQEGRESDAAASYRKINPLVGPVDALRAVRAYKHGKIYRDSIESREDKGRHIPVPKKKRF